MKKFSANVILVAVNITELKKELKLVIASLAGAIMIKPDLLASYFELYNPVGYNKNKFLRECMNNITH